MPSVQGVAVLSSQECINKHELPTPTNGFPRLMYWQCIGNTDVKRLKDLHKASLSPERSRTPPASFPHQAQTDEIDHIAQLRRATTQINVLEDQLRAVRVRRSQIRIPASKRINQSLEHPLSDLESPCNVDHASTALNETQNALPSTQAACTSRLSSHGSGRDTKSQVLLCCIVSAIVLALSCAAFAVYHVYQRRKWEIRRLKGIINLSHSHRANSKGNVVLGQGEANGDKSQRKVPQAKRWRPESFSQVVENAVGVQDAVLDEIVNVMDTQGGSDLK